MKTFREYLSEGDTFDNMAYADRMERIKQRQVKGLGTEPVRPQDGDEDHIDPEPEDDEGEPVDDDDDYEEDDE